MGRPAPDAYRDDPEADAVSLRTTRSDYEYDDAPELPSYSDSEAAAVQPAPQNQDGGGGAIGQTSDPYARGPPATSLSNTMWFSQRTGGKVQSSNRTSFRMDERLNNPDDLEAYVRGYLSMVPPRQLVRILGTHKESRYDSSSKKKEKESVTDFEIVFNFEQYFRRDRGLAETSLADNSDKVYRGSFCKTRAKGYKQDIEIGDSQTLSLQDHCRDFCSDKSTLKIFRVTRKIDGLDTEHLRTQIERFLRSTHYRGHVDISFPIEDEYVDIYNPHWINRCRTNWIRYIFYFTFLWIITWPILFFATKWWSVYTVQWLWSRPPRQGEPPHKVFASMSENAWLENSKNLIISLALERYQGDASDFPLNVPDERVTQASRARMPSSGNQNIDDAMNVIQGGMSVWNAINGRGGGQGGRDPQGWGYDT